MSPDTRISFTPNVVVGLGIVVLGVVLMLDRLEIIAARDLVEFWPLLLILFGASVVTQALSGGADVQPSERQRPIVTPGFVLFVAIAGLLFSHAYQRRPGAEVNAGASAMNVFSVMGQRGHASPATQFQGAEMTSVMGASELNLGKALLAPGDEAIVDILTVMGRSEIIVPAGWTVQVDTVPLLGRVSDRRSTPADAPKAIEPGVPGPVEGDALEPGTATPPRVVIRGLVLMGRLVIRSAGA